MAQSVQWSIDVQIAGVTQVSTSRSIQVEAYDSIEIAVLSSDSDKEVDVQPGGAGQVKFLAITSDRYGAGLTYKVNDVLNSPIILDQPQILAGAGAVGMLDTAPTKLFFSSSLSEDASVRILVGRDATPTS